MLDSWSMKYSSDMLFECSECGLDHLFLQIKRLFPSATIRGDLCSQPVANTYRIVVKN